MALVVTHATVPCRVGSTGPTLRGTLVFGARLIDQTQLALNAVEQDIAVDIIMHAEAAVAFHEAQRRVHPFGSVLSYGGARRVETLLRIRLDIIDQRL